MHHFKAKGGTHFNFNSDMSGDVRIHREPDDAVGYIPGADLMEFARWYAAEYGETEADILGPMPLPEAGELSTDYTRRIVTELWERAGKILANR